MKIIAAWRRAPSRPCRGRRPTPCGDGGPRPRRRRASSDIKHDRHRRASANCRKWNRRRRWRRRSRPRRPSASVGELARSLPSRRAISARASISSAARDGTTLAAFGSMREFADGRGEMASALGRSRGASLRCRAPAARRRPAHRRAGPCGVVPAWSARPSTMISMRVMPAMAVTTPISSAPPRAPVPCSICSSRKAFDIGARCARAARADRRRPRRCPARSDQSFDRRGQAIRGRQLPGHAAAADAGDAEDAETSSARKSMISRS